MTGRVDPPGTCHLVGCAGKGDHPPHPGLMSVPPPESHRRQEPAPELLQVMYEAVTDAQLCRRIALLEEEAPASAELLQVKAELARRGRAGALVQKANPVAVAGWLEVDRLALENRHLRARIDAVLSICDRHQRAKLGLADAPPVPSWVPEVQALLLGDVTVCEWGASRG